MVGNGICQMSGRRFLTKEYIGNTKTTNHSALPYIHNRIRLINIDKLHIDQTTYI